MQKWTKSSEAPVISDEEIKELLKANGEGHTWNFEKKEKHWMRNDHKMRAYREHGSGDFFFIENLDAVKQARDKNRKVKLEGF